MQFLLFSALKPQPELSVFKLIMSKALIYRILSNRKYLWTIDYKKKLVYNMLKSIKSEMILFFIAAKKILYLLDWCYVFLDTRPGVRVGSISVGGRGTRTEFSDVY